MPKHTEDPGKQLRTERAQAEQAGDTARVQEIDAQLADMEGLGQTQAVNPESNR